MRKFKYLKDLMYEQEVTQEMLAKRLKRSQSYVISRMIARQSFEIDEVYSICDYLGIPYAEIPRYFPRGGVAKPQIDPAL